MSVLSRIVVLMSDARMLAMCVLYIGTDIVSTLVKYVVQVVKNITSNFMEGRVRPPRKKKDRPPAAHRVLPKYLGCRPRPSRYNIWESSPLPDIGMAIRQFWSNATTQHALVAR